MCVSLFSVRPAGAALCAALLSACAPAPAPRNLEPVDTGGAYQAQYRAFAAYDPEDPPFLQSVEINATRCSDGAGRRAVSGKAAHSVAALRGERLSRGDLLDVRVIEDDTFTGAFVVSQDGTLRLPFLSAITAQGRSVEDVEASLGARLVSEGFYSEPPRVSVRVRDYSTVGVSVTGAVFEARPVKVGGLSGEDIDRARQDALGAATELRSLANALRNAGGVRPDADLGAVELRRAGQMYLLDLSGVIEGRDSADVMLLAGDEIHVPSRGCFQDALMRPSPISPAGVTLAISNVSQPALNNAGSAIGRDVRELPYGTRLMQAVVDANCVGGARATSAARSVALMSRNPQTGVSVVVERPVELMLRRADRDDYDPYLLPGDAIACYDSTLTNLADLGRMLGMIATGLRVP